MATLPKNLYSANREMKSILTRAAYGIDLAKLRSDNDRISLLNDEQFTELMQYINSSNTVFFFERNGLECIVLRSRYTEDLGPILEIYEPLADVKYDHNDEEEESSNTNGAVPASVTREQLLRELGFTSNPVMQINREQQKEVELEEHKTFLMNVPSYLRLACAEIFGYCRYLRIGLTASEMARKSAAFDVLDDIERSKLLEFIDEHSDDFKLVSSHVKTRAEGVTVLLHRQFWKIEHYETVINKPVETPIEDSPFASLLSLKGKLPKEVVVKEEPRPILSLNPTAKVEEVVEVEPEPAEPVRIPKPALAQGVASSPAMRPTPVEEPNEPQAPNPYYVRLESLAKRVAIADEELARAQREYDEAMEELQNLVLHKDF